MGTDPISLLLAFAKYVGYGAELAPKVVAEFATDHPELVDPPPAAPVADIDPDVAEAIKRGEL